MFFFLAKRLSQSILILFGVTLITFCLSFLMPADPVRMIAGRSATQATVESIRKQLGLDKPVLQTKDTGQRADLEPAAGNPSAHGRNHIF